MTAQTCNEEWCVDGVALPWASGFGRPVTSSATLEDARRAVAECVVQATPASLQRLYQAALAVGARPVDELLGVASWSQCPVRSRTLGLLLAQEAPRVEAVKFGLVLLAEQGNDSDRELLLQLGTREELTDTVVAILLSQGQGNEGLAFQLTRRVHGWGRVHGVERLADTTNPEIQHWLLREGFRSDLGSELLAFTCAMTGNLHEALAARRIDAALERGAAELFTALANGSSIPDLADYPFRHEAIANWLRHLQGCRWGLYELTALDALSVCQELSQALRRDITTLTEADHATALIGRGLASPDAEDFELAEVAASQRGLDTFAWCEKRVIAGGAGLPHALVRLFEQASLSTLERALDAARLQVALPKPGAGAQGLLRTVVVELQRFPGCGEAFIEAALASDDRRSQALARQTLASWARRVDNDNGDRV